MNKKGFFIYLVVLGVFIGPMYAIADQYTSGGKRDPFVPLIGVGRSNANQGLDEIYSIDDVDLQGIIVGVAGKKGAIINGEFINEGDKKGIFSIESVSGNSVKVMIGDEIFEIKLYEQ